MGWAKITRRLVLDTPGIPTGKQGPQSALGISMGLPNLLEGM